MRFFLNIGLRGFCCICVLQIFAFIPVYALESRLGIREIEALALGFSDFAQFQNYENCKHTQDRQYMSLADEEDCENWESKECPKGTKATASSTSKDKATAERNSCSQAGKKAAASCCADLSCAKVPNSGCESEAVGTVTCEKLPNPNPALKLWKCTCTRSLKAACTVQCGSKKIPKEAPGSLSDPVLP